MRGAKVLASRVARRSAATSLTLPLPIPHWQAAEAFAAARQDDVPELVRPAPAPAPAPASPRPRLPHTFSAPRLRSSPPPQEHALQRGVMPRAVDADGNTLLHAACSRGALRSAKLVVRWAVYSVHPPDRNFLNLQSADGYTALDLARGGGFRKMEEWLIALGALGRGGTGAGSLAGPGPVPGPGPGAFPRGAPGQPPPYHPHAPGYYPGHATAHPYGVAPYAPPPHHAAYGYPPPTHGYSHHADDYAGGYDVSGAVAGSSSGGKASDTYLMGALEAALGGGSGGGAQSEDRRRAQAVVRQVAEALEDREDMAEELEAAERARDEAASRAEAAESSLAAARADARAEVAGQREEEQSAVLSALGLAEERAVQMAAECETLREERDAIAAALDFVNDEMERLRDAAAAAEEEHARRREADYRAGYAAGLMAARRGEGEEGFGEEGFGEEGFGEEGFGEGEARVEGAPPPTSTKTKSTVASRFRDAFESMSSAKGSTTRGSPAALTPVPLSTRAPALTPAGAAAVSRFGAKTTTVTSTPGSESPGGDGSRGDVGHPGGGGSNPEGGDAGALGDALGGLQLLEVPLGD